MATPIRKIKNNRRVWSKQIKRKQSGNFIFKKLKYIIARGNLKNEYWE